MGGRLSRRMKDIAGLRFGRLFVLACEGSDRRGNSKWSCRCDCGEFRIVLRQSLTAGRTRSCGCLQRERVATQLPNIIHGESHHTPEYVAWIGMRNRCNNPKFDHYADYGGRGIRVCDEWMVSFPEFLAHVGRKPSPRHSLDRIDVNGNYEPGNVRWATKSEQMRNKRTNHTLEFGGERLCLAAWSERTGIAIHTIISRLTKGWTVERTLTQQVRPMRRRVRDTERKTA